MRASSQSSRQANLLQTFVWNAEHSGYRGRCKRLPRFVKSVAHRTTSLLITFRVFVLAAALALPAYALYTDGRTLVNNIGQTSTSSPSLLKDYTHAQGFRTGSHKFWLTGSEVEFETGGTHANQMDQVLATVNKATPSGTPGDAVAGLTATQASAGVTLLKTSWASEITILEANTDYVVVLWAGLINSTASVKLTDSDARTRAESRAGALRTTDTTRSGARVRRGRDPRAPKRSGCAVSDSSLCPIRRRPRVRTLRYTSL